MCLTPLLLLLLLQQHSDKAAKAEARMQEQHSAAREAFHQASVHARSAQQAEARCKLLEQTAHRAERQAESTAHVQQVRIQCPSDLWAV